MGITYSAGAGTTITSPAKNGTVKSFTGGKVRLQEPITTGNNGQLMASPVYTNRLITITGGTGSGQTRFITGQTLGQGDGDDVDLDVSEPWTTNPDGTSTYAISYILEDAATLSGLAYISRSGFWEWKRRLNVDGSGSFAWIWFAGDKLTEMYSQNSSTVASIIVANNGRIGSGYEQAGAPVFGNANVVINANAGDLAFDFQSGSTSRLFNFALYGTLANNKLLTGGGTHTWKRGKFLTCSYNTDLAGTFTIEDVTFTGAGTVNDWIRIRSTTVINSIVLEKCYGFESLDNAATETLTVRNCLFINTAGRNVRVHDDKTWNFVNPVNLGSDSTKISFEIDDLNSCNVLFSLAITVTQPDGTPINDADCFVYEGLLNKDLPTSNRVDTDSNGKASTDVLVTKYTFPSSVFTTTTYGNHALKVYEWLYRPFVGALVPDFSVTGGLQRGVVLTTNPYIVQTTQATALSDGSGITIEQTANGSTLLSYDTGTVDFSVGDTVTGQTSGATGIVTERTEGTTASGRIHLRNRNAIAFIAGENLQVSGATRAKATNPLVALNFKTHIGCNSKSLQTVHDYWAARQAEDTPTADALTSITWGGGQWAQIVFADGGGYFRTERNTTNTNGVFLSARGAGSVTYMTADNGTQYVPPSSVTLTVTVKYGGVARQGVRVRIEKTSDGALIAEGETNGSGLFTSPYNYTGDLGVNVVIRQKQYKFQSIAATIEASGLTVPVALTAAPTVNLP